MITFDLSSNTPAQRAIIEAALGRCDFEFERLLPRLQAETGRQAIPVTWEDLATFRGSVDKANANEILEHDHGHGHDHRRATLGLAYYSGRIAVEQTLVDQPELAQIVFLSEAAHMVDFFLLTPEERARIFDLFHEPGAPEHGHGWFEETGSQDYWAWVGEAWMNGFIRAYTDIEPGAGGFHHVLTDADVEVVRSLLGVRQAAPYFATSAGRTFHDQHAGVARQRTFRARDEALAVGLRPCRICRP